jgi:hypothetical protein
MTEVWAKLTRLCTGKMTGAMTTSVNLTPVGNLIADLKLGKGTIHLPLSHSSTAPSPTPINFLMWGLMSASGNQLWNINVDVVADSALVSSEGFFGPGTINGLKRILINEAYGSVDIYSNGFGGFYTAGKDVNIKSAKAFMILHLSTTAVGVGDVIKTRTATISIIGSQTSDMEHTIGFATIGLSLTHTAGGLAGTGITVFGKLLPPGITAHCFMSASMNIANAALNLSGASINDIDIGKTRPQNTMLAKIIVDGSDGNVYSQITNTGLLTALDESTDWTNAKSQIWKSATGSGLYENLKLRATLTAGTQPSTGRLLNLWIPIVKGPGNQPDAPFWQNTLSGSEEIRTSTLLLELSEDDGATILASGTYLIAARWFTIDI